MLLALSAFLVFNCLFLTSCNDDPYQMDELEQEIETITPQVVVTPDSAQHMVELYLTGDTIGWNAQMVSDTLHWQIDRQTAANPPVGVGISPGGGSAWILTKVTIGSFKFIHAYRDWSSIGSNEVLNMYVAADTASTIIDVTTPACIQGSFPEVTFSTYSDGFAINNSSTGIANGEYIAGEELGCVDGIEIVVNNSPPNLIPNLILSKVDLDGVIRTFQIKI